MKLGEVLFYEQPTKYIVESELYNQNHKIPVLTAGKSFILGYTNETEDIYKNLPCIIFDDFTTSIQYVDFPFKVKSSAMKILTTNNKYDLKYLYYFLSTVKVDTRLHKRYWISIYAKLNIKLPPLPEQERIAAELDAVSGILAKQKEQEKLLNDLIKSKFHEMFGDPVLNDKGWELIDLKDCVDFYNGKAHEQNIDIEGQYILVTSRCISSNFVDFRRTNELLFPLKINDIVMVMSDVPNGKAISKCSLIKEDNKYTLNQRICCLRNYSLVPLFLLQYLNRHPYFLSFDDGNAQTNLRKDDLLKCKVILPPLQLQQQFADFVNEVEQNKAKIKQSLNETETLYKSLIQKYFDKGENV